MLKLRQALLFCALLSACAADQRAEDDALSASELVAPEKDRTESNGRGHQRGDRENVGKVPTTERPAPRSCDDLQASARTLLAGFQACAQDADCVSERVEAPCLTPFLCQVGVSRDSDLQTLASDAKSLSLRYQEVCGDRCPVARCISPESLRTFCDPETKRCASTLRTTPEADAGATPAVDGGPALEADAGVSPPDAGSTPGAGAAFACTKNTDCAVKNVGNCCGYYPRCANVAATFDPPKCEGQAGVCGFPTIDSCECRANTCVSLQGGREI